MSNLRLIHSTLDDGSQAREVGRALVEDQLVACVNIGEGVTSIYAWEGDIQEDEELTLTFKTTARRLEDAMDRLHELHPYDCPEILVTEIDRSHPEYEDWVTSYCN